MDRQEYARRADALKQRLWRTALCYLSDEQAALEAVDSAVYKGLLAVHNLRQPEYFNTWLTRILINECKAEQRRRARLHPLELLAHHAAAQQELDNLPLRQAVAALNPKLRAVVVLRFFAGYTAAAGAGAASAGTGRFKRRGGLKDGAIRPEAGIRAVDAAAGNAARRAGVYGAAGTAPGKGTAASACGPLAGRGDELLCRLCDSGECEYALCSRLRAAAFFEGAG